MPASKRIMFINRRGPYGSIYAQEAMEVALVGAAFDQRISFALIDDGVFLLRAGQDPSGIGMKPFTAAYRALGDFDVYRVYVERESLEARGMTEEDMVFIPAEGEAGNRNLVEVVSSAELSLVLSGQDILLNH